MKVLLVLPAGENVRVTRARVPRRAMLRFSVLPLTPVAALTPSAHDVRIVDENVEPLDFETDCDLVGITIPGCCGRRGRRVVAGCSSGWRRSARRISRP